MNGLFVCHKQFCLLVEYRNFISILQGHWGVSCIGYSKTNFYHIEIFRSRSTNIICMIKTNSKLLF